jgi:hypothetical protein
MSDGELDRIELDADRWRSGDEAYADWFCRIVEEWTRRGLDEFGHA